MISGQKGMREIDAESKVVWELKVSELTSVKAKWLTGFSVLENGNLLLTNWLGHDHKVKTAHVFEITRDRKVVWQYAGPNVTYAGTAIPVTK